jgi:hypothetical protein
MQWTPCTEPSTLPVEEEVEWDCDVDMDTGAPIPPPIQEPELITTEVPPSIMVLLEAAQKLAKKQTPTPEAATTTKPTGGARWDEETYALHEHDMLGGLAKQIQEPGNKRSRRQACQKARQEGWTGVHPEGQTSGGWGPHDKKTDGHYKCQCTRSREQICPKCNVKGHGLRECPDGPTAPKIFIK